MSSAYQIDLLFTLAEVMCQTLAYGKLLYDDGLKLKLGELTATLVRCIYRDHSDDIVSSVVSSCIAIWETWITH